MSEMKVYRYYLHILIYDWLRQLFTEWSLRAVSSVIYTMQMHSELKEGVVDSVNKRTTEL